MQPTDAAAPHYTIRTESGKILHMSHEEMSMLVRKTMQRAKDESPRIPTADSSRPQQRHKGSTPSSEKRKRSPMKIQDAREDVPTTHENKESAERETADADECHRVDYTGRDELEAMPQPTFESFTVNTELEGSKQLSQMELNMLVRNSILKARQQTRAIQESSSSNRKSTPRTYKSKKLVDLERHNEVPEPQRKDFNATDQGDRRSSIQEDDKGSSDQRKQNDTVSVAESELTEPSALRRITDELEGSTREKAKSLKSSSPYLDSEEDVHEDVLRNARRMLRGMTDNIRDPIETIRNAHPLSPIADDEGTYASKESKKYFFPDTPMAMKIPDEKSHSSEKSRSVNDEDNEESLPSPNIDCQLESAAQKLVFNVAVQADTLEKDGVSHRSKKSSKSRSSQPEGGSIHDNSTLSSRSNHSSQSRKRESSLSKSTHSKDVKSERSGREQPSSDCMVAHHSPELASEAVRLDAVDAEAARLDVEVNAETDAVPGTECDARAESPIPSPLKEATATPTPRDDRKAMPRSRSVSRGKERLAQFYQRNKPKKQISPCIADPLKGKNRTDPEEVAPTRKESSPSDHEIQLSPANVTQLARRLDPEDDSPARLARAGGLVAGKLKGYPGPEQDGMISRPFSDQEIENIVHLSMDKAQQTAREEIQEMLQDSKRHRNKIGVKTANGYKLLSQEEIAMLVKDSMRKAREAAQEEIAELVRDSMQQARESAQAEIKELVQDSMRRARESALKEMSDIVKDSLRNARADDSTVISTSAFTLNSVPTYRQGYDIIPVVPAIGSSQLLPLTMPVGKHEHLADTIPEEVMSGSVFEGVGSAEWRERDQNTPPRNKSTHEPLSCDMAALSPAGEARNSETEHTAAVHSSTLVLHGIEVRLRDGNEEEEEELPSQVKHFESTTDHETERSLDKYEVAAIVQNKQVHGTNLCFRFSTGSPSSSAVSEKPEVGQHNQDFQETYHTASLPHKARTEAKAGVIGTNLCGGPTPIVDDEPHVEEITFVKKVPAAHGNRLTGHWKNTHSSVEKHIASETHCSNPSTQSNKSKSNSRSAKDSVPRDNLAPMSPSGWTQVSATAFDRRKGSREQSSRASKYSSSNATKTSRTTKPTVRKTETVTVTDELLAQMATLKGATITQEQLNKLLSRPKAQKEQSSTNSGVGPSSRRPRSDELEVVENKFCMNFMDLLSTDEDDEYTKAGSHSLASSRFHSRSTNWLGTIGSYSRGDTDLEGTFSGTDNEYSIGQSFSANDYSTFSDDEP